jgi:hypothetical protein
MNADLQRERANATVDVQSLKEFLGAMLLMSKRRYLRMKELSLCQLHFVDFSFYI